MRLLAPAIGAIVVCGAIAGACQNERTVPRGPAPPAAGEGGAGGGFDPGLGGACAIEGLCGDEIHELAFDRPNVYFVIDRSGSMAEPVGNSTRFGLVRDGAISMVDALGALINVGAALFPHGNISANPCTDGGQVMAVVPGGSQEVVDKLAFETNVKPNGGTPIAATLEKVAPTLAALEGHTVVLLLTDGGPNCNDAIACEVADCIPNIEGVCPPSENCCAVDHPQGGPYNCVDRADTVSAVAALAELGIDVYVIGIPGSEYYSDLLDEMAEAGGTAQMSGTTKYHRVEDLAAIGQVFQDIAAAEISCEIPLDDPPAQPDFTNVYFDCESVGYDPVSGWSWGDDTFSTVVLNGLACADLKSGGVTQVHVVTGCPTDIPK
jgi:hypothetical protein